MSHADDHTHADVNQITSSVMNRLAQSLKDEASRLAGPLVLEYALTKPKTLADGSAIFLFNNHREAIGLNIVPILLLISYNETAVVTMLALRPNNDDLSKSLILHWTAEQKEEILRQLSAANLGDQSRMLSAVMLSADQIPPGSAHPFQSPADLSSAADVNVVTDVTPTYSQVESISEFETPEAPVEPEPQATQETWQEIIALVQAIRQQGLTGDVDTDEVFALAVRMGFMGGRNQWNSIATIVLNGIKEAVASTVPARPTPVQ